MLFYSYADNSTHDQLTNDFYKVHISPGFYKIPENKPDYVIIPESQMAHVFNQLSFLVDRMERLEISLKTLEACFSIETTK